MKKKFLFPFLCFILLLLIGIGTVALTDIQLHAVVLCRAKE